MTSRASGNRAAAIRQGQRASRQVVALGLMIASGRPSPGGSPDSLLEPIVELQVRICLTHREPR
jgi:hypothetical protein